MPRNDDDDFEDRSPRDRRDFDDRDDRDRPPARKSGSSMGIILGIIAGVLILVCGGGGVALFFAVRGVRDAAERAKGTNDCRQIGLAFQNYQSANNVFPTNSYTADDKPLLSWRVHILPYIEQDNLYRQFNLNEPWDGPTNKPLLSRMPKIYAPVGDQKGSAPATNRTFYRGFSSPGAMFARMEAKAPKKQKGFENPLVETTPLGWTMDDVKDGQSSTILFLEAGESVEWTRPDDLDASPGKPFPPLGGARPKADHVIVCFVDGTVRYVKKSMPEARWRGAISIAGNDDATLD